MFVSVNFVVIILTLVFDHFLQASDLTAGIDLSVLQERLANVINLA